MKLFLSATLVLAASASAALAADAYVYNEPTPVAEPVTVEPSWSGPYVGVQIGYGYADTVNIPQADGDGILGGAHAGYNHDLGDVVLGAEVDYDIAGIDLSNNAGQIDGVARGKLKAGVDFGFFMPYATGGIAYAHGEVGNTSRDDIGYAVGGGADFLLTEDIIIGAEYLYHDFNNFDSTGVDIDVHTARAKVSLKF